MRQLSRPTQVGLGVLVAGTAAVAAMTQMLDAYMLTLAGFVGLHVMLAVSLTLTNGYTGLFSQIGRASCRERV